VDVEGIKQGQRFVWAAGDFPDIAQFLVPASEAIVDAIEVASGDRLLDIGTGTGNLAIPAAKRGAKVTGLDLTPELLDVARERAKAEDVDVEWIEGDAEALPFADDSFDRVTSIFGMIFAPRHQLAASEMTRVCAPGGRFAMTAWTNDGMNGSLFKAMAKHMPTPAEAAPMPNDWGDEQYVRDRFAASGADVTITRETVEFRSESTEAWIAYNELKLGPMVVAKMALEPQGKWDALRADLVAHYESFNAADDGSFLGPAEYLLAVGTMPA
jgi:ubiquinone/menaquinone biosynthesis C-methylase UbiE